MTHETESLFNALFALEDVRELLRQTAPKHELSDEQKAELKKSLEKANQAIKTLEELL